MRKRKLYHLFAAALLFGLAGCSSDELAGVDVVPEGGGSKDAVYMNVTVQLPVGGGTRSKTDTEDNKTEGGELPDYVTSTEGTEVGKDYENKVNSVLLVLADKDNKFIACGEKSESLIMGSDGTTVSTVQSVSKSVLAAYYGESELSEEKRNVRVFVFCNPTGDLREALVALNTNNTTGASVADNSDTDGAITAENWYDKVCAISENAKGVSDNSAIWGGPNHNGGFLMSSSSISQKTFPKKLSDWDEFTKEDNPFKLSGTNSIGNSTDDEIDNGGAIKVERSVARFDFKDGSTAKNNTYDVVKENVEGEGGAVTEKTVVQIQLQKMALVNMSNKFYYLRRVSADGTETGASLCGLELSNNYVVDTDAAEKKNGSIIKDNKYKDYFNFCLGHTPEGGEWGIDKTAREQWYTSYIPTVLSGEDDNPDWGGTVPYGDYKIWRYVVENTIPDKPANQKNGITTGVVFKGKMIAPADVTGTLAEALRNSTGVPDVDAILYAYGNDIFVRWTEVRAEAIERGVGTPMYKAVFGTPTESCTPTAEKKDGENIEVAAVYSDDVESADYKWNKWYNEGKNENDLKAFKKAATDGDDKFTLYQSSEDDKGGKGYYCYYFYWNRHNDNDNGGVMGPMEFGVVRNNVYKLAVTDIRRLGHPRLSENDPDPVDPDNPDEEGDVYLDVSVEVLPWTVRINNIEF